MILLQRFFLHEDGESTAKLLETTLEDRVPFLGVQLPYLNHLPLIVQNFTIRTRYTPVAVCFPIIGDDCGGPLKPCDFHKIAEFLCKALNGCSGWESHPIMKGYEPSPGINLPPARNTYKLPARIELS